MKDFFKNNKNYVIIPAQKRKIYMTQLNNSNEKTYIYNDTEVKIITVFNDKDKSIALVEDANGEMFEVDKNALK